jgi:hypothetical protein
MSLDVTENPNVRGCPACLKPVHRCETEDELRNAIAGGHAAAWVPNDAGDEDVDYFPVR